MQNITNDGNGIIIIQDGKISKILYNYIDSVSRMTIENFLHRKHENAYTMEMVVNAEKPIWFYNAQLVNILNDYTLHFVYYCKMNFNFVNTSAYLVLLEMSLKRHRKLNDNIFRFDVDYDIENIIIENDKIQIKSYPEVNISPDNFGDMQSLESIDDIDIQGKYKRYITENWFPMKLKNIKS